MADWIMGVLIKNYRDEKPDAKTREKAGKISGVIGILTNFLLFAIKFSAGLFSGSIAIMADAVNNLSDSGSSVIMLVGFKLSAKPADAKHPFGHARIEYLSGVIVSFVIIFLGLQTLISSVQKIFAPELAEYSPMFFAVLAVSALVKLWQCFFYLAVGRWINSQTVSATALDSRNDVIATLAVLIGSAVAALTQVNLDGILGTLVAVFILFSGIKLVIETANPLLGIAPSQELVDEICKKLLSYKGIIGIHDLAVHNYGIDKYLASVHCEVPAEQDVLKSHEIIDGIEHDFLHELNIQLVIHLDPVVTGDKRTDELHKKVRAALKEVYPEISMHDFRVVWGEKRSNIIFDVSAPFSLADTDEEIKNKAGEVVSDIDPSYCAVITVDRTGVVNPLES